MTLPLAPVYLDNEPVRLQEPRPKVGQVLAAQGRAPQTSVRFAEGTARDGGHLLPLDYVLDRTAAPTRPIYLTTVDDEQGLEGEAVARRTPAAPTAPQIREPPVVAQHTSTVHTDPALATVQAEAPYSVETGVSGQGNERGSLQSEYSRTETDTAPPGPTDPNLGFGSGTGKGSSSGARQSDKSPSAANVQAPTRRGPNANPVAAPSDRFADLHGKQGMGPMELHAKAVPPPPAPTAPNGTGSKPRATPSDPDPTMGIQTPPPGEQVTNDEAVEPKEDQVGPQVDDDRAVDDPSGNEE